MTSRPSSLPPQPSLAPSPRSSSRSELSTGQAALYDELEPVASAEASSAFPTHCWCGREVQAPSEGHRCRQCAAHCELAAYVSRTEPVPAHDRE